MRKVLSPNEIIVLKNGDSARRIKIGQMIGDGATCIAYEAERITETGAMLRCRVKECYPFGARIVREGVLLCWEDEDEKVAAFKRMKDAHELLTQLRNDETVGNSITSAELFEGNGTIYSVMELNHASTYESDKSTSLPEILDTMRVLTEVVGKIHRQGYLHLDIKPSNFLVSHNPSTWVWLFDVDSLTSLEELNRGAVHSVPYSQSWAAPEQFCGNITKICPATDIFAIGAILFEKIMGRRVTNDDMSLFAEWNFDIDILRNVNPKIKRCLAEIFRKTLSASVKRRCQTADELACLLENAKKVSEETVYLVSNCPPCTSYFQGRTAELQQIHDCFENGQKVVFLHGFGGIGKSELAKKYAETYANSYDAILFLRYKDSLEELICELDIQNMNEDKQNRMKVLKRLLTPRILLIIDNFDVEIGQDQFLAELLRFNSKILFTTRTDFTGVYTGTASQIEIEHLDPTVLEKLFLHHCRRKEFHPEEHDQLQRLFGLIEHHTLAAELLAKQMWTSGWSIETVLKKMENGLSSFASAEKVVMAKDEFTTKSRIPDIICTVFRISCLTDTQQQCLRNLYMLQFVLVDKRSYRYFVYGEWFCFQEHGSVEDLNALEELGWIRQHNFGNMLDEKWYYSIHPLILDLISRELKPSVGNCSQIAESVISGIVYQIGNLDIGNEAEQRTASRAVEFLYKWLQALDYSNKSNINHLSAVLEKIMNGYHSDYCLDDIEIFADYCPETLCTRLFDLATSGGCTTEQKLTLFKTIVWCDLFEPEHIERFRDALHSVIEIAGIVYESEAQNALQDFLELVFSSKNMRHWADEIPDDILEVVANYLKPETLDTIKKYISWLSEPYKPLYSEPQSEEELYAESRYDYYYDAFRNKRDDLEIAISVVEEPAFDIPRKIELLDDFLRLSFGPVSSFFVDSDEDLAWIGKYVSNTNWSNIQSILDIQMGLFENDSWDWTPNEPYHYQQLFWRRVHIALINNDYAMFSERISYMREHGFSLFYDQGIFDFGLGEIIRSCQNLSRCNFLFPAVMSWVMDEEPPNAKNVESPRSSKDIIEMYETIKYCAERACAEIAKTDKRYTYIESVYREYSRVLNEILDSPYKLRTEL